MALHGEGEPQPTLLQAATQAATIELFTQWQTYANGVHWNYDSFRSVDFRALAAAVLTAAGVEVKMLDVTLQLPQLGDNDLAGGTARYVDSGAGRKPTPYGLSAADVAAHEGQVQG